jgi:hypothetical protein
VDKHLTATARSIPGTLRQEVVIDGQHRLITDQPERLGGDVRAAVDYDHHSTPRRFDVAIDLGGELTDAQLERLARVARACPLRRSIEAGIEFTETTTRRPREAGRERVAAGDAS